jgi:hypothetical protein
MEGADNGKGVGNGHREEGNRSRQQEHGHQNNGGSDVNSGDRHQFNPGRNYQLHYNPGHDRGRAYGGYARGWQRQ